MGGRLENGEEGHFHLSFQPGGPGEDGGTGRRRAQRVIPGVPRGASEGVADDSGLLSSELRSHSVVGGIGLALAGRTGTLILATRWAVLWLHAEGATRY